MRADATSLSAADTVEIETPAPVATSVMLTRRMVPPGSEVRAETF
jgi:hypothetical protein